ncbi:tetratricopeptide repeat protein [Cellulophaga sp. F20128]|uniref:tetratricopeptide repeat protein n=1 Tax=Cellulophaga sp. F20128 TaxID=2926413 RepID=UPI001FF6DB9F|nr:tetratricopeptide repeat protein [Cellulophaga sp. F20128]MCK0155719.1 tetratricopeptide repeat protein [Cellulophaga sp. F20128]
MNLKKSNKGSQSTVQVCIRLLCLFVIFSSMSGAAQSNTDIFKHKIDSIVKAKSKTYLEIEGVLGAKKQDTVLMRYFIKESVAHKYAIGQIFAYNQLGTKYRNLAQYVKAIKLHEIALDIATEVDNLEFTVYSLNMLGVVYRRSDAIKTALDYNQKALELAESAENRTKGLKRSINVSHNSIGNIYQILEQYNLAIDHYKRSLKQEEELGNKLGLAINHQNIGESLEAQGNLEEALRSYEISLRYNNEINSDKGRVICRNSIAQIYIKQDRPKEALALLEPALLLSEELGDKYITVFVEMNIGWANMKLNRFDTAEPHILRGLNLAKKHNMPRVISMGYKFMSELESLRGNYKESLNYYTRAIKFDDEITSARNLRYVNDVIVRYESEKKTNEIENLKKDFEIAHLKLKKTNATFLIMGVALLLLTAILFVLYRQHQLNNERKLLTLEQKMLRSQMNPHFLFNSLNSIKLYIINNEKKNAVHYLNKFSKLVRKILEASSLKEISLADELETAELYMNIENIRFSNKIDFSYTIDKSVDVEHVKIPSLILQPFLENALWHGLSSKEGEKVITMHISKIEDGYIKISIVDNGIGRAASERIKENKVLKRKSLGVNITKERLANFSKDYLNTFNVEFVDLFDDDKNAIGTEVVLTIPII